MAPSLARCLNEAGSMALRSLPALFDRMYSGPDANVWYSRPPITACSDGRGSLSAVVECAGGATSTFHQDPEAMHGMNAPNRPCPHPHPRQSTQGPFLPAVSTELKRECGVLRRGVTAWGAQAAHVIGLVVHLFGV